MTFLADALEKLIEAASVVVDDHVNWTVEGFNECGCVCCESRPDDGPLYELRKRLDNYLRWEALEDWHNSKRKKVAS